MPSKLPKILIWVLLSGAIVLSSFGNRLIYRTLPQQPRVNRIQLAALEQPARLSQSSIPDCYKPLSEINKAIFALGRKFPGLVQTENIGSSSSLNLPIIAVKVSANAREHEDEPKVFFAGVHHAREPIGANICLALMTSLCDGYRQSQRIRNYLDKMEIWFVPVVNPDGYKYIFDNDLKFPWWRKNLRDNDGDGRFDPTVDGVDLNRNYDYNWRDGGDEKGSSWFYRGEAPFSENETRAIMNLAKRENFVVGVSYHSYGEAILFPWGNFKRPPDLDLIVDVAGKMAARIQRQSGYGTYSILPLNGQAGQSSIWMYGHLKIIDFIVEVGTDYFPNARDVPAIVEEHLQGAYFLLDRVFGAGVTGHVFDEVTKAPLSAHIEVSHLETDYVNSRKTDPRFGRFHRLLLAGTYDLTVTSEGYETRVIHDVDINKGSLTMLEIGLRRAGRSANGSNSNSH